MLGVVEALPLTRRMVVSAEVIGGSESRVGCEFRNSTGALP
ncbi:hypothetical protein ACVIU7_001758 [Bradyrhizobium liaoningense]